MTARTAVVTIAGGRPEHLRRQRQALRSADLHVVVSMGEPASGDGGRLPPTVRHHVEVTPAGLPLAAARNAGARIALGAGADVIVFLDVDCIPGRGLLDGYTRAAERTGGLALLCGPVTYLPPPPPEGYPATGLDGLAAPHAARPVPPPGSLVRDRRFELFWSLSFAVSAATWRRLGGFHEGYVGYGAEDTDFAVRAEEAGAELWWVGGADAFHQHHPESRTDPARVRELVANARLFATRHGWWPMATWLTELDAAGRVRFDPSTGHLEATA